MLTFHEAVTELQKQEDDVLDSHKALLESNPTWLERHVRLLSATREVDYDQDGRRFATVVKNLLILPAIYILLFIWLYSVKYCEVHNRDADDN